MLQSITGVHFTRYSNDFIYFQDYILLYDIKGSLLPHYITHHHPITRHTQDIITTLLGIGGCNKDKGFCDEYGTYQAQNMYFQKQATSTTND